MPRAGGIYSPPPGTDGVPNTPIESAKYNAFVADITADQNVARPVTAGGTGGTSAVAGNDGLNTTGADMASAATLNLANATGVTVNITGTTTITSLGTVNSGAIRTLVFAGALTLTHNATSLILPGGANITTAAGDVATFRSKGAGNWVCVNYQRSNGRAVSNTFDSPTITTNATITSTATGTLLTLESTDAGATAGPDLELFRNSASPAANEPLGRVVFAFKDSAGNKETGARIHAFLSDPTNASEDVFLTLSTIIAGALANRVNVGAGMFMDGAVGADPGAGKFNAVEAQQNGVPLITAAHQGVAKAWVNFNGTGTVAIRDSFNVTSVTDNGVGWWTANLSVAQPSADYAVVATVGADGSGNGRWVATQSITTTAIQVKSYASSASQQDSDRVSVVVFGD